MTGETARLAIQDIRSFLGSTLIRNVPIIPSYQKVDVEQDGPMIRIGGRVVLLECRRQVNETEFESRFFTYGYDDSGNLEPVPRYESTQLDAAVVDALRYFIDKLYHEWTASLTNPGRSTP
jgi:hypothetical protein